VSFEVSAEAYGRFMGRYSEPLAAGFADLAGIDPGQRVLDVGCGPGALTAELVSRVGAERVCAVDPSRSFTAAVSERFPAVDVRLSPAERLPFPDGAFDTAMAQLVVHFMAEPVTGLREMGRVTLPGGTVAACVWDYAGGSSPLTQFWRAARDLDPAADGDSFRAGASQGHLIELFGQAGLAQARESRLVVRVRHPTFDDWWERFNLGVGPGGDYLASRSPDQRDELRERCRQIVGAPPIDVTAAVWAVTGRSGG